MWELTLDETFLTGEERSRFADSLAVQGLDDRVWDVFACAFGAATPRTRPVVLRAYEDGRLSGAAILVRCSAYGATLFDRRLPARAIDLARLPMHVWLRAGCAMDMLSNPGFAVDPDRSAEVTATMTRFLARRTLLTLVYDASDRADRYPGATALPALPRALVDTSGMHDIDDYLAAFKNLRRKEHKFANQGGTIEVVPCPVDDDDLRAIEACFVVTAEHALLQLPYQDLYLPAALATAGGRLDGAYCFVARLGGEFVGYQAALRTGQTLSGLHGAFRRDLRTTYHAYDLLFVEMVRFAVEHGLELVDFGAVLNETKRRMVNRTEDMAYFVLSRMPGAGRLMAGLAEHSKLASPELSRFRGTRPARPRRPSGTPAAPT